MTASVIDNQVGTSSSNSYLFVPIILFFVLLIVAVLRSPHLVSNAGIAGAMIVATPLVLATYSVMAIAMAGRGTVDLSIGPLIGFINVTLVQLFGAGVIDSPVEFFVYAIGAGIAYQLVMGLIIVFIRVQPIIVSLSGYLALSGINLVIMARPGGTVPDWMEPWGLGISIYSPVTVILVLSTVAWLLFSRSAFYGHLRLMGSDERAAYTSGVRINLVRLGAHVIAGIYAGLATLTYTSLISSGDPTQGTTYTLIAVTALVLGGTSLAGGRGGVMGSLLGALNIYLITTVLATFNFGAVQSFVTDLSYGLVLVISLLLTLALPHIQSVARNLSPLLFFVLCSLVTVGVIIHATYNYSAPAAPAKAEASTPAVSASAEAPTSAPPSSAAASAPAATSSAVVSTTAASASAGAPTSALASSAAASGPSAASSAVVSTTGAPASAEAPTSAPPSSAAAPGPSAASSAVVSTTGEPASAEALTSAPASSAAASALAATHNAVASTAGGSASAEAPTPAGTPKTEQTATSENFIFEDVDQGAKFGVHSTLAKPVTYAAVLILSLLLVLRVVVAQAKTRTLSPLVHVVAAALVLLLIYVAANPANTGRALGATPVGESR